MRQILTDAEDGTHAGFEVTNVEYFCVAVNGTFGSATVALEASYDGGTTYQAFNSGGSAVSWTAADDKVLHWGGAIFRFVISGGTGESIDAFVEGDFVV